MQSGLKPIILTEAGSKDLNQIYEVLEEMLLDIKNSVDINFKECQNKVFDLEKQMDILDKNAIDAYFERLKQGQFDTTSNYTDILSNLERIGDHMKNIASSIIDPFFKDFEIIGLKVEGEYKNVKKFN